MKTRKLIKETGMRTDIFHTGDGAYCGKESELWYIVGKGYAVYPDNSRNENGLGGHHSPGLSSC